MKRIQAATNDDVDCGLRNRVFTYLPNLHNYFRACGQLNLTPTSIQILGTASTGVLAFHKGKIYRADYPDFVLFDINAKDS